VVELKHIYLVGTPAEGAFASLGRSWEDTSRIRAFAEIGDAVFAEASGDVCIPGYFAGEEDPMPMASCTPKDVASTLRTAGFGQLIEICQGQDEYEGEVWIYARKTNLWVEQLTPAQANELRTVFDRHADPAIVGRRSVYRVEVK